MHAYTWPYTYSTPPDYRKKHKLQVGNITYHHAVYLLCMFHFYCLYFDKQTNVLFCTETLFTFFHLPPVSSTRTCYRTCFEDSLCKSHVSVVNEQRIRKLSHDLSQYSTQRIFSPRYGKKNYRQSTNCR